MKYTNSPLVTHIKLSPNHSGQRTHVIDRITPHCVVGQCTAESLGTWFSKKATQASSNYGIDKDGRIGLYVEEKNRSWCSSSPSNDQRAVTIECASDLTEPFAFRDVVYQRLIELCADICSRNNKKKLIWIPDKDKALAYQPKSTEMLLTVHRWFADKSCPGEWLMARMGELASEVTKRLTTETVKEMVVLGACVLRLGAGRKHRAICGMRKKELFVYDGQYDVVDGTKWLHGFYSTKNEQGTPIRYGGWVETKYLK